MDCFEMANITVSDREVVGSAKELIKHVHTKPIWGYVEGVLNGFTAVKDHRNPNFHMVTITLKVPTEQEGIFDAHIEDPGIGFVQKYSYLERKIGYDTTTKEYADQQNDENYLNKMGIGIPSICNLSKSETVEFRTVSLNEQHQEMGLVCTYLGKEMGWKMPAEPLSPDYVLDRKSGEIKTGTRVIIRNVKEFSLKKVSSFLQDIFARKLGGPDKYRILIRETPNDEFTIITRPPNGPIICTCNEQTIGTVRNKYGGICQIRVDLHPVEKIDNAKVDFLIKKVKMGEYDTEFLMKGHVWCSAAEFKPDREGVRVDLDDETYQQIDNAVIKYATDYGMQLKSTDPSAQQELKKKKTWKDKADELFLRYYEKNGDDTLLKVMALHQSSFLDGDPQKGKRVRKNRKIKQDDDKEQHICPKGQRWDAELGQCVDIQHRTTKNKKHKHRSRKPKNLSDTHDLDSIPNLSVERGNRKGRSNWFAELDVPHSTIWLDSHYPWVNEHVEESDEPTMELLIMVAMMKAVPENKNMGSDEFFKKLVETL